MSGGLPQFTSGLPMSVLSLEYSVSLPWYPSNNIDFFYLSQKYHLKDKNKILKKIHVGFKLEWDLKEKY